MFGKAPTVAIIAHPNPNHIELRNITKMIIF